MKTLKVGGLQEMGFLKNRIGRAYGRGEICRETFERLSKKAEDMIEELEQLPEWDGERVDN